MGYRCVVLVKQVPDTKNLTGEAMKADGTVNRAALPAIFNPEDLHALEMALDIRDRFGGTVTVITMGPPAACEVLRESLYRGADDVVLLTDRAFAASDTLATSYALGQAVKKLGQFDIILCGRQAIDGDTAQVGPQTAEKLELPQICYVERVLDVAGGKITARRAIEGGYELLRCKLPALLTVTDTANEPRPPRAKRIMQFKNAAGATELAGRARKKLETEGKEPTPEAIAALANPQTKELQERGILLKEWAAQMAGCDPARCGGNGSPTRVKKIESVVLAGNEVKQIESTEPGIRELVHELITSHILD